MPSLVRRVDHTVAGKLKSSTAITSKENICLRSFQSEDITAINYNNVKNSYVESFQSEGQNCESVSKGGIMSSKINRCNDSTNFSALDVSEACKSKHLEILFGLFLRFDESELSEIAEKSRVDKIKDLNSSLSEPVVERTKLEARKLTEHADLTGSSASMEQPQREQLSATKEQRSLHNSLTQQFPSEITLLPEILNRFHVDDSQSTKTKTTTKIKTQNMKIPKPVTTRSEDPLTTRRKKYANRDLKEVTDFVLHTFHDRVVQSHTDKASFSDSSGVNHPTNPTKGRRVAFNTKKSGEILTNSQTALDKTKEKYNTYALQYNECSLSAIATWAGQAATTLSKKISTHLGGKSSSRFRNKPLSTRKRKYSDTEMFYRPATSAIFRKCQVCEKYGHYEAECESLKKGMQEDDMCDVRKVSELLRQISSETHMQRTLNNFFLAEYMGFDATYATNVSRTKPGNGSSDRSSTERTGKKDNLNQGGSTSPPTLGKRRNREFEYRMYPWINISDENKTGIADPDHVEDSVTDTKRISSSDHTVRLNVKDIQKEDEKDRDGVNETKVCRVCSTTFQSQDLILCSGCNHYFHRQCLYPPDEITIEGEWYCAECSHYESDVSSTIDIEGLDDFVIEQRKNSFVGEIRARKTCVEEGLFGGSGRWNTSVCILEKDLGSDSSIVEDLEDVSESNADASGGGLKVDLARGELCWGRRPFAPEGKPARDFFWPATFQNVSDGSDQCKYVVKPFAVGIHRMSVSEVLPFFPHYEEHGYKRIKEGHNEEFYTLFIKGLNEAITELGLKSFGQARKIAQEITNTTKPASMGKKKSIKQFKQIKPAMFRRDFEWMNCDETEIDGFLFFARSEFEPPKASPSVSSGTEENGAIKARPFALQASTKYHFPLSLAQLPSFEKLVGSIVAYSLHHPPCENELMSDLSNYFDIQHKSRTQFAVLAGLSRRHRKFLVHKINDFDKLVSSVGVSPAYSSWENSDALYVDIKLCSLGASSWIPIQSISFIAEAASTNARQHCQSAVTSSLSRIRAELFREWKNANEPIERKKPCVEKKPDAKISGSIYSNQYSSNIHSPKTIVDSKQGIKHVTGSIASTESALSKDVTVSVPDPFAPSKAKTASKCNSAKSISCAASPIISAKKNGDSEFLLEEGPPCKLASKDSTVLSAMKSAAEGTTTSSELAVSAPSNLNTTSKRNIFSDVSALSKIGAKSKKVDPMTHDLVPLDSVVPNPKGTDVSAMSESTTQNEKSTIVLEVALNKDAGSATQTTNSLSSLKVHDCTGLSSTEKEPVQPESPIEDTKPMESTNINSKSISSCSNSASGDTDTAFTNSATLPSNTLPDCMERTSIKAVLEEKEHENSLLSKPASVITKSMPELANKAPSPSTSKLSKTPLAVSPVSSSTDAPSGRAELSFKPECVDSTNKLVETALPRSITLSCAGETSDPPNRLATNNLSNTAPLPPLPLTVNSTSRAVKSVQNFKPKAIDAAASEIVPSGLLSSEPNNLGRTSSPRKILFAHGGNMNTSRVVSKSLGENRECTKTQNKNAGESSTSPERSESNLTSASKVGETPSHKSSLIGTSVDAMPNGKAIIKRTRNAPKLLEANTKTIMSPETNNGETSIPEKKISESVDADKPMSLAASPQDVSSKSLDANRGSTKRSRHTLKATETNPESPIMQKTKNGETLFFAEGVLGERTCNGCREYRIKWKGYSKREATWEPEKKFLHSNFLRSYLADKIATKLRNTPEAKDARSVTSRAIRILVTGLHMLCREHPVPTTLQSVKKRRCLFCLKVLENNRAFGGHIRLHQKDENYDLIKEASRHVDGSWFENEE